MTERCSSKPPLYITGLVGFDAIVTPTGSRGPALGGPGVYASMGGALLADVHLVAAVGEDFEFGHRQQLQSMGIDVRELQTIPRAMTYRWRGRYPTAADGSMSPEVQTESMIGGAPLDPARATEAMRQAGIVFLGNADPEIQLTMAKRLKGALLAVDSNIVWIANRRDVVFDVMSRTAWVFATRNELAALTGRATDREGAQALLSRGAVMVVCKRDARGVAIFSSDWEVVVPAWPVPRLVDPTGAGDSFAGAFLSYVMSSTDYKHKCAEIGPELAEKAAAYAGALASFVVQSYGSRGLRGVSLPQIRARADDLCGG